MKIHRTLLMAILSLCVTSRLVAQQQAKEGIPGVGLQSADYFYTGKPYDGDLEAYTFKYRNYDPAMARWTSVDPSGFPNGANNCYYAPIPTSGVDPLGLWYDENYHPADAAVDFAVASSAVNWFGSQGYTVAEQLGDYSLANAPTSSGSVGSSSNPEIRLVSSSEVTLLKTHSAFTDVFNKDYFSSLTNGMTATNFSVSQLVNYGSYSNPSDAFYAYGRVAFSVSGSFTYVNDPDRGQLWVADGVLFSFDDKYDFNIASNNPAIAAFARLQAHDLIYSFINSGDFFIDFAE